MLTGALRVIGVAVVLLCGLIIVGIALSSHAANRPTALAGAAVGDGVCANSFTAGGWRVEAPPMSVQPIHTNAQVLTAALTTMDRFKDQGLHGAYFAIASRYGGPTTNIWVVEVNGVAVGWGGQPSFVTSAGRTKTGDVILHHFVQFLDDSNLQLLAGFACL